MTALDLRLAIAQQIDSIPDSEQMLLRVLQYLRRIPKTASSDVVLTGDALRLWNRTEELSRLPHHWDGLDAEPIQKKAASNMHNLLKQGISSDFSNWVLFPDEGGTLLMQSRDGKASISIGNNAFSYVYEKDGKLIMGEKVRFSPKQVLNVLRAIQQNAEYRQC